MPLESVGPYRIAGTLGEGAFGAVYDATHEETGRRVAVKLLHASTALQPEIQNRFVREIALLQRLDHENIVRHYDCGLHEGSIYCAMELIDSGTVRDRIKNGRRLPWRDAAKIALQTASGLAHAHEHGCVHRDLKPANLYLSTDGRIKIGDLGLARDLDNSRLTAEGHTVGTWRYMAPEQIMGQDEIDGRLDLYALGCIMHRMVTGEVPFDGADFAAIFDQHLETPPPRADAVDREIPAELADLIEHLLQKKPVDRPDNASVVVARLKRILSSDPDSANRVSLTGTAGGDDLQEDPTASYSPIYGVPAVETQHVRSPNWTVALVVLGVAAVVAVIVAMR
jgi:serine/threonine protein kinase